MIRKDDTYQIGRITKTHGLKGEVVFAFTDPIFDDTDCNYLICEVEGILVPFFIEEYRFKNDSVALVKFDGIDSIEQAQPILGSAVYFEKKYVNMDEQDEVSLSYFIGFGITGTDEGPIGTIVDIDDNTDNWLFVVERSDGSECLIPAHDEFIINIDHNNKTIEMNLPAGLLDL